MAKLAEDIMIFSQTKLSGHAAHRFGWALVKDPNVTEAMQNYISSTTIASSVVTLYKSYDILRLIYEDDGFVNGVGAELRARWQRLLALFAQYPNRYSILSEPNTAYLYLLCKYPSEQNINCYLNLLDAGLSGFPGFVFGEDWNKFRINLTIGRYSFELLMQKLAVILQVPPSQVQSTHTSVSSPQIQRLLKIPRWAC